MGQSLLNFAMVAVGFVGLFFGRHPMFARGTVWWVVHKELYLILLALGVKQLPLPEDTRLLIFVVLIALGTALSWTATRVGLGMTRNTWPPQ
jgi:uncharacterized membrane protein